MLTKNVRPPDLVPTLSRGKHRNPRKGACFMEFASFLAGERWSDHPACTHPLLAHLARLVNDHTSDEGRRLLVPFIPSVIGLTGDDPHIDVRITLRAATTALPVVAEERQRVMAVAVLAANRLLADQDGRPPDSLDDESRRALSQAPHAAKWARRFTGGAPITPRAFRRRGAPSAVTQAVAGIADACIPDPDRLLRELLVAAIDDCAPWVRPATGAASSRDNPVVRVSAEHSSG
ncbi:MAG TPA: hypothetical protein VI011_07065 [Asanoa sp.]